MHLKDGIRVLLDPSSKLPCVFCGACGEFIATLKDWQKYPYETKARYREQESFLTGGLKFTFSDSDSSLRSMWNNESTEKLEFTLVTWKEHKPGFFYRLFTNFGTILTEAIRYSEKEFFDHVDYDEIEERETVCSKCGKPKEDFFQNEICDFCEHLYCEDCYNREKNCCKNCYKGEEIDCTRKLSFGSLKEISDELLKEEEENNYSSS